MSLGTVWFIDKIQYIIDISLSNDPKIYLCYCTYRRPLANRQLHMLFAMSMNKILQIKVIIDRDLFSVS